MAGLRTHSKALPKAKFAPKKESWSLFGGLLLVWPTATFQIPGNHYLRDACSANWWDAQKTEWAEASTGQQSGPNSLQHHPTTHCTTNASKAEQIGLWSFASSAIFTWPLTNSLALLQASRHHFSRKMLPQTREAENAFREFIESWSTDFYATKINYFLPGKNELIVMVPIWLIKMCLNLKI